MTEKLELKVDVGVQDINWIKKGSPAMITNETETHKWSGKVVRIGKVVNQQTQSINVYIEIEPNADAVYDGIYLKAEIPGQDVENAMIINRGAIFDDNKVFVLRDSILKVRPVKIHRLNTETAIISGLESGLDLVSEPLVDAHNNMKAFKIQNEEIFSSPTLTKN